MRRLLIALSVLFAAGSIGLIGCGTQFAPVESRSALSEAKDDDRSLEAEETCAEVFFCVACGDQVNGTRLTRRCAESCVTQLEDSNCVPDI